MADSVFLSLKQIFELFGLLGFIMIKNIADFAVQNKT